MKSVTLDVIRGVAAMLIVLFHFTYAYNDNAANAGEYATDWGWSVPWGYAAVATFFMLSGYLAARVLAVAGERRKERSPKSFVWHKLKRFYPTYWIAMTLTAVVLALFFAEEAPTFVGWAANLTMVSQLMRIPFVDGAYWYMQCELVLCLLTGALVAIRSPRRLMLTLGIWVTVAIILSQTLEIKALRVVRIVAVAQYCHNYIAGIVLYGVACRRQVSTGAWVVLALCFANAVVWNGLQSAPTVFFVSTVVLVAFVERLDGVLPPKNRLVRCLTWLAGISYPLYLCHEMIGFTIIRHMRTEGWSNPAMILVPIAVCILLAWGIDRVINSLTRR